MIFLSINPSKPLCIQAIGLLSASAGFAKRIQFELIMKVIDDNGDEFFPPRFPVAENWCRRISVTGHRHSGSRLYHKSVIDTSKHTPENFIQKSLM